MTIRWATVGLAGVLWVALWYAVGAIVYWKVRGDEY